MSKLLVKCEKDLNKLLNSSDSEKKYIIENCKKCLIKAISEIVRNCLLGNIPMEKCRKNKLKRYKNLLLKLANKSKPLEVKRSLIIQKGTGFLSILLPIALETVRILIDKIKSRNTDK